MCILYRFGFALLFVTTLPVATSAQSSDLPREFKQILPRGRIAAITNPNFVSAAEAEVAADSYVLGVVIAGEARAYSLNLLNSHEIVNDQVGNTAFAAVW